MVRLLISEPSLILKSKLNAYTRNVIEEKDDFNYKWQDVGDFSQAECKIQYNWEKKNREL